MEGDWVTAGWRLAAVVTAVFALAVLGACSAVGQDDFPGFEVAAQAGVVHVTPRPSSRR